MPKWHRVQHPWRKWDIAALRRNLGVYVHIPFCLSRCNYCDFLTYGPERPAGLLPDAYQAALTAEIRRRGGWAARHYGAHWRAVDSVFIGGGTPTCLKPQQLVAIISALRESFPLAAQVEFTVEANPDTITPDYIAQLAHAGVNRLSVGVQATQPRHLQWLGRTHRWAGIQPVLEALRSGPVPHYSFDLIYGVPGLTRSELKQSVRRLMALGPEHVSAYELTCEPGTPYARWAAAFPRQVVGQAETVAQRKLVARALADHGLYRYEVSNYARPGSECRHNLRYWRGGDYIGLGLGAASRIGTEVVNNPRDTGGYEAMVKAAGTADDPLAGCAAALDAGGRSEAAGGRSADAGGRGAGAGDAWMAPPADTFLQLRTRAGVAREGSGAGEGSVASTCGSAGEGRAGAGGRVQNSWLRRGWVRSTGGRLEVTSAGLDFADLLAREM